MNTDSELTHIGEILPGVKEEIFQRQRPIFFKAISCLNNQTAKQERNKKRRRT